MKKLSRKQRERDVKIAIIHRQGKNEGNVEYRRRRPRRSAQPLDPNIRWIHDKIEAGELNITIDKKRNISVNLPERMDFNDEYESTALYMAAIRRLSILKARSRHDYHFGGVSFDNLKSISTSAALVLTAELSKWDDKLREGLVPDVCNWDPVILKKFIDLGFFNLFKNSPDKLCQSKTTSEPDVRLVKYIKGRCGDGAKVKVLKKEISDIVGEEVCKWTFLHSGLTEAITNVTHHAYPSRYAFSDNSKNWYLSGSYSRDSKELKIVFYDQGIGIPKSLPASQVWERILSLLSVLPIADRKKDEVLLKAAVQASRTSTGDSDRGRGLQDLLVFIRKRGSGYLSILSSRGLYKFMVNNGNESAKTEHFNNKIQGTLIIWSVTLND